MNFKELKEKLEQFTEEQLNEMAIKPWKALPAKKKPMDCINSILQVNQDRVNTLLNNNRKDRQLPKEDKLEEQHRVGCQSKYKLFNYNGIDYYFGVLWGEEDKVGNNNRLLKGNGISHILVNHGNNFNNILKGLNLALATINPAGIKQDKAGNLELIVHVGRMRYVFKNYKELNDNYFYLHTAY